MGCVLSKKNKMIIPNTLKYPKSCGPQCTANFEEGYPNHDKCRHSFTKQNPRRASFQSEDAVSVHSFNLSQQLEKAL
jgi:hypothetical protein